MPARGERFALTFLVGLAQERVARESGRAVPLCETHRRDAEVAADHLRTLDQLVLGLADPCDLGPERG